MSLRFSSVVLMMVLFISCKKDKSRLDFNEMELPVKGKVRCIEPFGDSLLIAGGDVNGKGFLLVTDENLGQFEVRTQSLKHEVYDVKWHLNRWYIGMDSVEMVTSTNLRQFNTYWWNRPDWVGDLYKQPIRRFDQFADDLFAVAGGKLAFGVVYHSSDSGRSWNPAEFDNEIRAVCTAEVLASGAIYYVVWAAGDGILLKAREGHPYWERIEFDNKFVADIHFLNQNQGILVTYEGDIFKSEDGGESWDQMQRSKKLRAVNRMLLTNQELVVLANSGQLAYSKNLGKSLQWYDLDGAGDLLDGYWNRDQLIVCTSAGRLLSISVSDLQE